MRFFLFLLGLAFLSSASTAQDLDGCKETPSSSAPKQCPIAPLGVGAWTMKPVTNVTAFVQKDGIRAYDSKPIGRSSIAATFDPLDCTGTARIDLLESGRSFELRQVFSEEEGSDHATLVGKTVVQPALNLIGDVEVRASNRNSAILSMTVNGARFADVAKGGVVLRMEHTDKRDIHPYCDCRTSLRDFLDDKIAFYQGILAGYESTQYWLRPEGLDPEIAYDYGVYNQFMLMVTDRGMSPAAVAQCFNVQYALMTEKERETKTIGSYFAREGRAGASTDNSTCEMHNVGDDEDSCYPSIIDEMEFVHESVHQRECTAVMEGRHRIEKRSHAFEWMRDVKNFEVPIADPDNTEPQALAETEARAYRATIAFLEGWEEDNCEPK